MELFQHQWKSIKGEDVSLANYKGKVILIVNTASKCGLTPQYEKLQAIYDEYKDQGLVVLGFPCNQFLSQEPGGDSEIESFCTLNYGVSFPLSQKIKVNGKETHPLFKDLKKAAPGSMGMKRIQWNFNKFLISKDGKTVERFGPKISPNKIRPNIEAWLQEDSE